MIANDDFSQSIRWWLARNRVKDCDLVLYEKDSRVIDFKACDAAIASSAAASAAASDASSAQCAVAIC